MNYIYNYYIFYLRFKTINNFFPKTIFRSIKKAYKEEKNETLDLYNKNNNI